MEPQQAEESNPFAERGTISSTFYGINSDHDVLTCSIDITFPGSGQSFGNLALNEKTGPDFLKQLLSTFSVATIKDLVGSPCIAYRCFDFLNARIEAIGPTNDLSKKFIIYKWAQAHDPDTFDPFDEKADGLLRIIDALQRRIEESKALLRNLSLGYRPIPM